MARFNCPIRLFCSRQRTLIKDSNLEFDLNESNELRWKSFKAEDLTKGCQFGFHIFSLSICRPRQRDMLWLVQCKKSSLSIC